MKDFLFGWAIISTLINIYVIWLLSKKPLTENNIENLKQKNKRNKQSNIDNDISSRIDLDNTGNNKKTRKERKILTKKDKV